jgi:hypothetical protein
LRALVLSRRRLVLGPGLAVLAALALPVVADAARPLAGTVYTGTGVERMNNGPTWRTSPALAREPLRFHISATGNAVLAFRGSFFFYCGAGTDTVRAKRITVGRAGRFAYRFSLPTRRSNRTVSGETFVSIAGSFTHGGHRAKVSYLVVFSPTAHPAHDPYLAAGAFKDGCAAWVKGTASAH